MEKEIFSNPITALADGIYLESIPGTIEPEFALTSHLFDGTAQDYYKLWDFAIFPGSFGSDAQVRFGFTDVANDDSIEWTDWTNMATRVPMPGGPRESVYLVLDFKATTRFRLAGVHVFGEKMGAVS